jgi:hypothetical protein
VHQIEDLEADEEYILVTDGRLHFADAVLYLQLQLGLRYHAAVERVRDARDGWTEPEQEIVMPYGSIAVGRKRIPRDCSLRDL